MPAACAPQISMPIFTRRGKTSSGRSDITAARFWMASLSRRKSGASAFRSASWSVMNTVAID